MAIPTRLRAQKAILSGKLSGTRTLHRTNKLGRQMGSVEGDIAAKKAFAVRLKAEIKRCHFSHRHLAELVDASKQSVTNWTQGTHEPSLRHVRRLSEVLQVPVAHLLDDEIQPAAAEGEAAAIVDELASLRLSRPIGSLGKASPTLLELLARAERQAQARGANHNDG